MDQVTLRRWKKADRIFDNLTLFVGMLMILYVGIAVFGLVSSSARHYSTFVLFNDHFLSRVVQGVYRRTSREKFADEGYEEAGAVVLILGEEGSAQKPSAIPTKVPLIVWIRGAVSLLGSILRSWVLPTFG